MICFLKIIFLVGSGKLKLNTNDISREDAPHEIKELIEICTKYDRDERFDFIEVIQVLQSFKILIFIFSKILNR